MDHNDYGLTEATFEELLLAAIRDPYVAAAMARVRVGEAPAEVFASMMLMLSSELRAVIEQLAKCHERLPITQLVIKRDVGRKRT